MSIHLLADQLTHAIKARPRFSKAKCRKIVAVPAKLRSKISSAKPATSRAALRRYAGIVARRSVKGRNYFRMPPFKKPALYQSALQTYQKGMIPPPPRVAKILGDLGSCCDAFVAKDWRTPDMERGIIRQRVMATYTRLHYLKKVAQRGCTSPALKKAIDRLTKDMKLLRPMYNHIAQVAFNPRRVFVYGTEFKVRSKVPLYLSRTFAIGDALYRIPYHLFKKYVNTHIIDGKKRRLRLTVIDNKKVTFAGEQDGQTITNNRSSPMISWDISVPLHELGHYIDQEAGLFLGLTRLSTTPRLKQAYERRMRLAFPSKTERDTALRLSEIYHNKFKKMTPQEKVLWKKVHKQIEKHFFRAYSITNEVEFFAVAFRHYFESLRKKDRIRVAKFAPEHYKVFEAMRKGVDLKKLFKKASVRTNQKRLSSQEKSLAKAKSLWVSTTFNHSIAQGFQRGYDGAVRTMHFGAASKLYHFGGLLFAKAKIGGYANIIKGDTNITTEHGGFASIGYGVQIGKWWGNIFAGASLDASVGLYFPKAAAYLNSEFMAKMMFKVDKEVNLFGGATVGVNARVGEKERSLVSPYAGFALGVGF